VDALSKRRRDGEQDAAWLDDDGEGELQADLTQSPESILRHIAEHGNSDQARVAAARVLLERGAGAGEDVPMMEIAREIGALSGEALEDELVGFFNPGAPPEPPSGGGEPLSERMEREVERRVKRLHRRAMKSLAKRLRADDPVPQRVAAEAVPEVREEQPPAEQRTAKIYRLDTGEVIDGTNGITDVQRDKLIRQDVRNQIREERRRAVGPGLRQHIPPGMDPRAWDRAWRR
jgi:hypothetical protein